MEPTQLLNKSITWVNDNRDAYYQIERQCMIMRCDNRVPRVKHAAEIVRGNGVAVSNSALAFVARLIEHNTGVRSWTAKSKIDDLLTEDFWKAWDKKH